MTLHLPVPGTFRTMIRALKSPDQGLYKNVPGGIRPPGTNSYIEKYPSPKGLYQPITRFIMVLAMISSSAQVSL